MANPVQPDSLQLYRDVVGLLLAAARNDHEGVVALAGSLDDGAARFLLVAMTELTGRRVLDTRELVEEFEQLALDLARQAAAVP